MMISLEEECDYGWKQIERKVILFQKIFVNIQEKIPGGRAFRGFFVKSHFQLDWSFCQTGRQWDSPECRLTYPGFQSGWTASG